GSSSPCWPLRGLKAPSGFCLCWASACTSRATAASSSSWLGGRVADRNDAIVPLAPSMRPPGSAGEIATPATRGARRIRVHSSSVKSCLDVMATSWERGTSLDDNRPCPCVYGDVRGEGRSCGEERSHRDAARGAGGAR